MKLYDYPAAAAELGIEESWLRDNIAKLPRTKIGRAVKFTEDDLDRIVQMFHHEPSDALVAPITPLPDTAGVHPLRDLKPLGATRRAS